MVHTLRLDNYTPIPRKLVLGTNSSFGTESIKIERGAGWDGLNLTATWHIPGREEPLRVALLDGDAMDVPPEVTKEAKDGVLVLAGLASGVQRASCNVEYLILEQAGVYGGADAEPTPELAAQVLEAALQAKADAEAAAEDAAAAKANADKAQADAEKAQQAEIEASTIVLDDATKLSLMLAEIPTEAKPTMPPKLGYKWVPTYSGTAGFAWELQEDPNAYGTHDRSLYWVDGMTVCTGYYYTDGDKLYMALQDGAAPALDDTEWFEVM